MVPTAGALATSVGEWALGKVLDTALERVLEKRTAEARAILFEELAEGVKLPIEAAQEDDFVAIVYRFHRSATEGAARLNMRLLASIIAGQREHGMLSADKFLYYADLLASLRREEVILVGTLQRHSEMTGANNIGAWPKTMHDPARTAYAQSVTDLVPSLFPTEGTLKASAVALMRTGLIREHVMAGMDGWSDTFYYVTPLMDEVWREAKFDHVLRREGIML